MILCDECDGKAEITKLIAPDPQKKMVLKPQRTMCPKCKGLGVINAGKQN